MTMISLSFCLTGTIGFYGAPSMWMCMHVAAVQLVQGVCCMLEVCLSFSCLSGTPDTMIHHVRAALMLMHTRADRVPCCRLLLTGARLQC